MKNRIVLSVLVLLLAAFHATAQVPTANSFSSYVPYNGIYRYGANPGYYGANWSAQQVASLAMGNPAVNVKGVGVKTLRVPLYDDHLTNYGINAEMPKIQFYNSLGGGDYTAFVGSPHHTKRETTTYPGSPEQAKTFKNLYQPIWLDAAQTQINPNNLYAKYLHDVVNVYGSHIKFWEIVNEPDYTYSAAGWQGDMNPPQAGSWFDHDPTAAELVQLRAPIYHYIRMLRISWEVIKKLRPNSYVCIGGIGYRSFLDAVLRNTDNPNNGAVSAEYPLRGGAYFDVLSFHVYPMYNFRRVWNNTTGQNDTWRNSDEAVWAFMNVKQGMETVLANYGYNNSQFPKKQVICTETGVSRIMSGGDWGSIEGQRNYIIKNHVLSQKNGIGQVYWFQVGDGANSSAQFDQMGMYFYFGNATPYNATLSHQGIAAKTTSDLLYGRTYDAARTAALGLNSNIDGAAFRGTDGSYVYVLWAKTKVDLSENASATYTFPSTAIAGANVIRREWNFSQTNTSSTIPKTNVPLNGSPAFFTEGGGTATPTNQSPTANAGPDQAITLPVNSATLTGTGADPDGTIAGYAWSQISGPSQAALVTPTAAQTAVNNLVQGIYNFELRVTDNQNAVGRDTVQVTVNAAVASATTFRVEAEAFTAQQGVQTENTGDAAGGGQNVGWIDNGDWMDYSINPATAGTYTVSFRVATPSTGGQLQLRRPDGTVLATVTLPNTGAFQTYQMASATVTLAAGVQTVRVISTATPRWNFNWMDFAMGGTTPTPTPATTRLEAEAFTAQQGVQTEGTWDAGGGQNVGWIDQNDWMEYAYDAPATGNYTLNFRIATPNTGAQFQIRTANGTVLGTVTLPNTGGYQTWQTTSTTISLTQGQQTLRLVSTASAGWNFNWFELTPGGSTPPPPPPPPASTSTFKVEAEAFTAMQGVQTENTWDAGGGQNVGWIDNGDWMDYSINPSATGSYTVRLRIATPNSGAQLQLRTSSGTVLATVNLPNTTGYQAWQTVTATVNLTAGAQTIRVLSSATPGWNFNWMDFTSGTGTTPTVQVTGRMEAENFVAQQGVQTEGTWDAGGGQNVGWIDNGDWMEYAITAASAATHSVRFRVATPSNGAQFQVRRQDGTVLATVSIPSTGGWQSFQTITANVALAAGTQTLRIVSTTATGWNFNWFEIVQPNGTVSSATAGTAEIETTSSIEISPNPVTDKFVLKINNSYTGVVKVSIGDLDGNVVKTFTLNKSTTGVMQSYLSIKDLPAGNYILRAEMEQWSDAKPITKK